MGSRDQSLSVCFSVCLCICLYVCVCLFFCQYTDDVEEDDAYPRTQRQQRAGKRKSAKKPITQVQLRY